MAFKFSKIEYIPIQSYKDLPTLHIENWEAFLKLVEEKKPKSIYYLKNREQEEFLFVEDGLGFTFPAQGFKTIDDILDAVKRGFNELNDKFYVDNGVIKDREGHRSPSPKGDIYYAIRKLGYNKLSEYVEAFSKGFGESDADTYRKITKLGYERNEDYSIAVEQGFKDSTTYYNANKLGFDNMKSYAEYLKLEKIKEDYKFKTFDEAHVFAILNRSTLEKRKTLNEIQNILLKEKPGGSYYSTPKWYTESFSDRDLTKLAHFLSTNTNITSLGIYNKKEELFENYSDIKILVDGSNVAWNNGSREAGDKPKAKNIRLIVQKLSGLGVNEIDVLCDASLRLEVEDEDEFDELLKKKIIKQVPSKTDADEFIINYAKKFKARILTNDTFKDWALKDKWVSDHANELSIRFMIIKDEVELSGINGPIWGSYKAHDFDFKGFENTEYSESRRYRF